MASFRYYRDMLSEIADAIAAYQRALAEKPDAPNSWYNLARLQRKNRQYVEALASYQRALDFGIARPEEVRLNRGVIYAENLRQDDAAEVELRAALALEPNYVPALLNLGNLHEDQGRREAAAAAYGQALASDPRCFLALARLANLTSFSNVADPLLARLRLAVDDAGATAVDRADLNFALGRALDACGEYSRAFEAYKIANDYSRRGASVAGVRYDRTAMERLVDRLIAAFPIEQSPRTFVKVAAPPRPIFICGMFRSGSTLTEQLLAGHSQIMPGGEIDLLPTMVSRTLAPFPESLVALTEEGAESLASRYLADLAGLFPFASFVTDKRPDNFLYIGLIKRLFPGAKIVHTRRDPLDNCLSIFFLHLDHGMAYALDLLDTGHYYRQYRRLMTHWKAAFGQDIIDVDYDALVRAPRSTTEAVLQNLGLPWEDGCSQLPADGRSIKTASVWQVREPLHVRSSGRARHYERELAGLRAYLVEP